MKTQNITIAMLLVCVAVLGMLYLNKCREASHRPVASTTTAGTKPVDNIWDKCSENCNDTVNACGMNFSEKDTAYIQHIIRKDTSVYGYQISLKYIDELYKEAHAFNNAAKQANEDTITGIQIYEAMSERMIGGKKQFTKDLVVIPYLSNCMDVYHVDDHWLMRYPIHMYAHFRPCPKLCQRK